MLVSYSLFVQIFIVLFVVDLNFSFLGSIFDLGSENLKSKYFYFEMNITSSANKDVELHNQDVAP